MHHIICDIEYKRKGETNDKRSFDRYSSRDRNHQ